MGEKYLIQKWTDLRSNPVRLLVLSSCFVLLGMVYLFQDLSWWNITLGRWMEGNSYVLFVYNKTVRFLLNDLLVIGMIWAFFYNKDYIRLSFTIQLIEIVVFLPFYYYFKLTLEGATELSSPLFSQIHRLIINPVLMFVFFLGLIVHEIKK